MAARPETKETHDCTAGTTKHERVTVSFRNAMALAPMVRVSTLPLRLLCMQYGANMLFGPEIEDYKLIHSNRKKCAELNTVDFVDKENKNKLIFRTLHQKREPVICQIGSCDAVKFLKASRKVCQSVHGIDLNMGCPQPFSINKGIGASLLDPKRMDVVHDMLSTFKRNKASNHCLLSVKIRLLKSKRRTIELCQMLEKCGIDGMTVHARYVADRSEKVAARYALVHGIKEVVNVPIVYNGDVFRYADITKYKKLSHCDGVMIARGAICNPSVFDANGMQPINHVIAEYLDLNERYKYALHAAKVVTEKMILSQSGVTKKSRISQQLYACSSYDECRLFNSKLKAMFGGVECKDNKGVFA